MNSFSNSINWYRQHRCDFISGALVFLIALPLCLGISIASGFPAIAGIITAGVGGILTALISDSPLTIKGPAAGLIVIVLGCITDFGFTQGANLSADVAAYRKTLAVGVVAGMVQIVLALLRMGAITEMFPSAVIHGMLAAIGCIIILKQVPVALGLNITGSPLELAFKTLKNITELNPEIAAIGVISLLILILCGLSKKGWLKKLPAPLLVILASVPLAYLFDLEHAHVYSWHHNVYHLSSKYLINLSTNSLGAIVLPDFSALTETKSIQWIILFSLIGTIESLVSLQAIDFLDPLKRKSNPNRDLFAVGLANSIVAVLGGLPMISEIVRSRANIDNGAKSSVSNGFHGVCLLFFVAIFPGLLHRIPLAALAAMLIFTGYRLTSVRQFIHIFKIGWDQFFIFIATAIASLSTDLLIGLTIGISLNLLFYLLRGTSPYRLLKPKLEIDHDIENNLLHIQSHSPLIFSNWINLKKKLSPPLEGQKVRLDLSFCPLIDASVLERIHDLKRDFLTSNLTLEVVGLSDMKSLSQHPFSLKWRKI